LSITCVMFIKLFLLRSSDDWCYNDVFVCMFIVLAVTESNRALLNATIFTELLLVNKWKHTSPVSLSRGWGGINSCVRSKHMQI
jgi:hypothetical protein